MLRPRSERGETLVEICIALVIIGAVVGSFFAAFSTASTASKSHRDMVSTDAILRDDAEATKAAVRSDCTAGTTWSVTAADYTPPAGYTVNALTDQPCPPTAGTPAAMTPPVTLTATMPGGVSKSLTIEVRSP